MKCTTWSAIVGVAMVLTAPACVVGGDEGEVLTSTAEGAATTGPPGTWQTTALPAGDYWYFYDRGAITGTDWRSDFYCSGCDSWGFGIGDAPLGYGENYLRSVIDYGGVPAHRHITSYFKKHFYLRHTVRALFLRVMYDDGFVFYINGREGGRANMPGGTITPTTLATAHEAENKYVVYDISSQIPNLEEIDINWLAFEVHQASPSSSDLVFAAELIAWVDGPLDVTSREGIERGSSWHFWDRGGAPTTWKSPALDDSGWSAGPAALGYGETYLAATIAKGPITTYFRKQFTVEGSVHGLRADVLFDDGFVAYLNGTEIGRASIPSGAVNSSTLAANHEATSYATFDWDAALPLLVPGENLLAVEVHQNAASSSDLVFDLGLTVEGSWSLRSTGGDQWFEDSYFADPMHGWIVGWGGAIVRTVDGGATWIIQPSGTEEALLNITFVDAMNGWICGHNSTLLHTTDGGATWSAQSVGVGVGNSFYDMSFVDANHGWLAGRNIYATTDGGATWTEHVIEGPNAVTQVDFFDEDTGWATTNSNESGLQIFRTDDGGVTWAAQGPFISVFESVTDLEVVSSTTIWVTTRSYHDDSGEVKLVSRDGGATWTYVAATSNDLALDEVTFIDDEHGWAIGAGGSIIATRDGGETWQIQQVAHVEEVSDGPIGVAPYYRTVNAASPDELWIVGSRGAVLHTTTGGW